MSETKINLEEIALNFHGGATFAGLENCYYEHEVIKAMREACRRVLELAAENAEICDDSAFNKIVDTQSILDTINQVE